MAPQQSGINRTFVNLTDNPAEGRGARRTYIRRAVMKSYHERRSQKKRASTFEADATEKRAGKHFAALIASIDRQMAPQSHALVSIHGSTGLLLLSPVTSSYSIKDTQVHPF